MAGSSVSSKNVVVFSMDLLAMSSSVAVPTKKIRSIFKQTFERV